MADVWESILYPSSFGGIPIDIVSISDSFRRSIVRFGPPRRDGAILQDMGADARETRAQILFFEREPDPGLPSDRQNHARRAVAFVNLANSGRAQEFVHPIYGSFPALVEDCSMASTGEERDLIVVDATFVEQGVGTRPLSAEMAEPIDGAAAAVATESELANQAATDAVEGGTLSADQAAEVDTVVTDATATVDSWQSDPDITPRDVTAGLQRLSTTIADLVEELELAQNPANYPLNRALQRLHFQVRRAANLARRDAPALIEVTLASAVPLRIALADVYGAEEHDQHYDEAIRLNEIDDPSLLPAGRKLTLPTPDPVGRQATRRKGGDR